MKVCWFCGTEARLEARPTRNDTCSKCGIALKCCKNCRFFDPASHNQCREPAAEWVRDKEVANFCEHFDYLDSTGRPSTARPDDAKKKFDDLFKH